MILLALGANLEFCGLAPEHTLVHAMRAVEAIAPIKNSSRLYAFPAWPDPADPPFCNAVLSLASAPSPADLLQALQGIEAAFGRRRNARNAPRTLDIDILAYDELKSLDPRLVLPHPGLEDRLFVLEPLAEIAPDWVSPRSGKTAADLLKAFRKPVAKPATT
jgi:2-amino-4-hydroxy-6-hydroxymethyldihydropteridine diphosphokinase